MEGRGFFTDALEVALESGAAGFAVHSLKDLPVDIPPGLEVAAVLERGDARDALVSAHGRLADLPRGAVVGTDSSRRRAQIGLLRPDLRFEPLRGNVPTRLAKLDRGDYDAVVIAKAALDRLGLAERATEVLAESVCLPAPGQGAVALEVASGGEAALLARRVNHAATMAAVTAERAFLAELGGGCSAPIGAWATIEGGVLSLLGAVFEGGRLLRAAAEGDPQDAAGIGRRAAASVRS